MSDLVLYSFNHQTLMTVPIIKELTFSQQACLTANNAITFFIHCISEAINEIACKTLVRQTWNTVVLYGLIL